MALESQLFAHDKGLQACLVNDSAHLTPGTKGKSVELVQAALIRLRFLEPNDGLAEAGNYGPRTAAAVLSYKQMFSVINSAYQKAADNIVGRMTIALLDTHMCVLDSFSGKPLPLSSDREYRPVPTATRYGTSVAATTDSDLFRTSAFAGKVGFGTPAMHASRAKTSPIVGKVGDPPAPPPNFGAFPNDMQETIRRSNLAKAPGTPSMYPFIGNHEGPLSDDELARRFDQFPGERKLMMELYSRMRPFGIWGLIKTIRAMYWGTGARGMFVHPFDHARAFAFMQALATGPVQERPSTTNDITRAFPVMDSRFCKDAFNVHGERDSWREIVTGGPGLHICVTNASGRARTDENYPSSDFHIDEIQQGQFCSNGTCIPLMNGQTIGHLKTVGPWLAKQPGEWLKKNLPKF